MTATLTTKQPEKQLWVKEPFCGAWSLTHQLIGAAV